MEQLRDLYRRRDIELAIFNELTDEELINASIYRIKAVDAQIKAARTALEHNAERLRHEARTSVERVKNERRTIAARGKNERGTSKERAQNESGTSSIVERNETHEI